MALRFVRATVAFIVASKMFLGLFPSPSYAQTLTVDEAVEQYLRLADMASGRIERVENLKQALKLRPGDPQNIVLEYRIGVALAQHSDPSDTEQPRDRREAAVWFRGLIERYKHLDYYADRASARTWGADFLVPRAKLQLATLPRDAGLSPSQARELLISAMEDIEATYYRRVDRWLQRPKPTPGPMSPPRKLPGQLAHWEEQVAAAKRGDVLHDTELLVANRAVTEYAHTYGHQKVWEVRPVMQEIIDHFPDTPIARIAALQIARAEKKLEQFADQHFDESLEMLGEREEAAGTKAADFTSVEPALIRSEMARERREVDSPSSRWVWGVAGVILGSVALAVIFRRRMRSN